MNKKYKEIIFSLRLECIIPTPVGALALYVQIISLEELRFFRKLKSETMNIFFLIMTENLGKIYKNNLQTVSRR